MSGTARTLSYLLNLFRSGQGPGSITAQDVNDFVATIVPGSATLTSGSSVTMSTTILRINKTSGSATAVALPITPIIDTQVYTITDQKGDAATNNITVSPFSGTINGASSFVINVNHGSISLAFDGTNWTVV